jgi:hypothetical protein
MQWWNAYIKKSGEAPQQQDVVRASSMTASL